MEITAKIPNAELIPNPGSSLDSQTGQPVFYARLLMHGGSVTVKNPNKYSGLFDSVTVEVRFKEMPVLGKDFDNKNQMQARLVRVAQFGSVIEAIKKEAKK